MTTVSDLRGYLTRLAQHFDQNLRTNKNDPTQKGWGQFIAAEHHSNQIGLYGTNAGILVKTIADPTSTIDDAIVAYLTRQWNERTQSAQRYFNQTARLAFFVLALGRTTDERLITLRDVAATELVARQQPDGSWGDW